jgi:ABC-type multidrug transport system ATPase subunit
VRSGHAVMAMPPVLAAGVGARHGCSWALRTASFRMDSPVLGRSGFGIAVNRHSDATAIVDLLAGQEPPCYGELRVLGEDMGTADGRAAVRQHVGVARKTARLRPAYRVRGLIEHAARLARLPGCDSHLLTAAIIDRLALSAWADVQLRSVPETVLRRTRLAAAAVHEPNLLILDSLLDDLPPPDAAALAAGIRDLGRDTAIVATGSDARALALACDEVLTMADGIIIRT